MNCQLCQREMEAYREEKLSPDMKTQVEDHLKTCRECAGVLRMQIIADKVIEREKKLDHDPFLSARIMASIENSDSKPETGFIRVLRPALISVSLAAAVFFGIILGNLTRPAVIPQNIPVELAMIDDAALESIEFLSIE